MTPLLDVKSLTVKIGGKTVCERLNLTIETGQSWALLGRNGAGKTTLVHQLAGLRSIETGEIWLNGHDLTTLSAKARAREVGVLLQHSSRGFGASVFETVLSGRHPHLSTMAWESAEDHVIAKQAITRLGLEALLQRSLDTLSGGELRRVELARLLAQETPLCLLDEPMNHLDLAYQASTLDVLHQTYVAPKRGMLMVMHDLNLAYRACDHWLILLGDGHWQAGPRHSMANSALLSQAYGHSVDCMDSTKGMIFLPQFSSGDMPKGSAAAD